MDDCFKVHAICNCQHLLDHKLLLREVLEVPSRVRTVWQAENKLPIATNERTQHSSQRFIPQFAQLGTPIIGIESIRRVGHNNVARIFGNFPRITDLDYGGLFYITLILYSFG